MLNGLITIKVKCWTCYRRFVDIDFPCNGLVYALFIDTTRATRVRVQTKHVNVFGCAVVTQALAFDTDLVALAASTRARAAVVCCTIVGQTLSAVEIT